MEKSIRESTTGGLLRCLHPNASRSTNAVVAKALNARRAARNSVSGDPDAQTAAEKMSAAIQYVKGALDAAKRAGNPGAKRNVKTIIDALDKLQLAFFGVRAANARRAANMSQRVREQMRKAYDALGELVIALPYARELITRTEADENEDVLKELPKLDRYIAQANQMYRGWLR